MDRAELSAAIIDELGQLFVDNLRRNAGCSRWTRWKNGVGHLSESGANRTSRASGAWRVDSDR